MKQIFFDSRSGKKTRQRDDESLTHVLLFQCGFEIPGLEHAISKPRKYETRSLNFYQAIQIQAYACSEGAFPFFFSRSISRFAVANSSSEGIFTIMRYITFCLSIFLTGFSLLI